MPQWFLWSGYQWCLTSFPRQNRRILLILTHRPLSGIRNSFKWSPLPLKIERERIIFGLGLQTKFPTEVTPHGSSAPWPEKKYFWLVHTNIISELPKCKGTLLQELLKKITDSMDCKLYCAYIMLFICEDILGFIACIEILIMCQSRTILSDDAFFQLTFIPLVQRNLIRIFVFVIVIHNLFHWIQLSPLIDNASCFLHLFTNQAALLCRIVPESFMGILEISVTQSVHTITKSFAML